MRNECAERVSGLRHCPAERRDGSPLNVKVQVNDALSRHHLSRAVVEVYVNYTRTNTALTGKDGGVLLHVPLHTGLPVTFVASKNGFISTALPYKTNRTPIFSSVTVSLLAPTQGNIWLFEDSVQIFSKTSDASLQPVVTFPQSLLNLTHSSNVTSIQTFLTFPHQQHGFLNPPGIVSTQSGYVGVELSPVASVSVQLYSGDSELHVSGPVQIRLRVPISSGLQTSDVVPAWFFNRTTGGWMREGLGRVTSVDGKLLWMFTAPHLGYWVAAPLSSTRGFSGPVDFFFHHASLLTALVGGTLIMAVCLLVGLLYYCRRSSSENNSKKTLPVMRRDQTTSTCDEVFEISSGSSSHPRSGPKQTFTESADNGHSSAFISLQCDGLRSDPEAVAVMLECNELELNADLRTSGQIRVPPTLTDSLFFYNQHVAILHAPAFIHMEDQPEQVHRSRSSTLPRVGASNSAAAETLTENNFTQTLAKSPCDQQNQAADTEQPGAPDGSQAAASSRTCRGPFSLPESVSVPGTLNRIGHNRHALAGASKVPSPQPPRAWFVSLEGKPAAEIQHPRRRRPVESRETSLDSGVDMSELNQTSGRRAVTLERNATFVKSKQDNPQ
ncbi:protein FAM171B-like isoform X2 [Mugil cephalus]|uniref:protein FAM171B-like isoform X2 n=1 Tax=Mugil cephalus TaxID=48193 RepID=UPI001FB774C0|nr:protein FAM171B-like isoform X2 [Mugil cephalus]